MFSFEGDFKTRPKVSLGGASRKVRPLGDAGPGSPGPAGSGLAAWDKLTSQRVVATCAPALAALQWVGPLLVGGGAGNEPPEIVRRGPVMAREAGGRRPGRESSRWLVWRVAVVRGGCRTAVGVGTGKGLAC
jgi:hypothetical protein